MQVATLVGCAIGDALGNRFEMRPADNPELMAWDGSFLEGGYFWRGQPGQYTDDTKMTMALAQSLIDCGGFDPEDIAKRYLAWYESGDCRGIGGTTRAAIERLQSRVPHTQSGLTENRNGTPIGGNGTAMRASPLGLFFCKKPMEHLLNAVQVDAAITHNSDEPKMGSLAMALGVRFLAGRQVGPDQLISRVAKYALTGDVYRYLTLAHGLLQEALPPREALATLIGSDRHQYGYVAKVVAAAFYCLGATDNFRDCVVMAVKSGGDADTTAAMAGALAGTWYGLEGIPEQYKTVEDFARLQEMTNALLGD